MRVVLGILSLLWKLYIAVIFTATAFIFYPIILPFLFGEKGKRKSFYLFVAWSWVVRVLCLIIVVKKTSYDVPDEPHIIIANHASYLDIFLLHSILPKSPFLFLGKSEILTYPLIKTYFKRLHIPVDRKSSIKSARALITASKEVNKGWSLVIFPEGGIPNENSPKMIEFKEGAFQLAKSINIPIVPVTFTTNYKLFSDPTIILGSARPGISEVYIHPHISSEEVKQMTKLELKEKCFKVINAPILERFPKFKE
jgi:1-acyl-sn-glycerol-3-phosphate acyltransferase